MNQAGCSQEFMRRRQRGGNDTSVRQMVVKETYYADANQDLKKQSQVAANAHWFESRGNARPNRDGPAKVKAEQEAAQQASLAYRRVLLQDLFDKENLQYYRRWEEELRKKGLARYQDIQ